MCGIVGFTGNSSAVDFLVDGLSRLEYRGYDSAGITLLQDIFKTHKTTNRIDSLKETLKAFPINSNIGIGHTRWATHGIPSIENAHPHISENGKFAVVHNGIIENYSNLKAELISEGYHFKSQTDTEVIPQLLEKYYKGDIVSAVRQTLNRLQGSYALGILCVDLPDTIITAKRFSPLIIGIGENENLIASDVTAIINHTKKIVFQKDGDIAVITPQKITLLNSKDIEYNPEISSIDWDVSSAQKGEYQHFMMKEIKEQPFALKKTLKEYIKGEEIIFPDFSIDKEKLKSFNRIQIIACGSAYHVGVTAKYIFEELLKLPTDVDIASEYRYRTPIVDNKTLCIAISQSGETADTLTALKTAKEKGAHTLAIVNVFGSSIANSSHDVIYTLAGPEIAVATTKGYTTQLSIIYLFGLWGAKLLKSYDDNIIKDVLEGLTSIPQKIQEAFYCEKETKVIAHKLLDKKSIFFIGRGTDYATSLEASLKLKEISYIHSQSYPAGELKHGTISLIEEGAWVFALCANQNLMAKTVSNIKEVTARKGSVAVCALENDDTVIENIESTIFIPKTHPLLTPLVEIIPFQFIAYYTALYKGCDIDKPRNLAKSVTVE